MNRASRLYLLATFVAAGCADMPVEPAEQHNAKRHEITSADRSIAHRVGVGFAQALANPERRMELLEAFRVSPWAEHKLVLQRFVTTEAGQRLLEDAARALGMNVFELAVQVRSLPDLDFYLPFREHRMTWEPSERVLVAASFEKDSPTLVAFGESGEVVTLRRSDGTPPTPLLILHPAQTKFLLKGFEPRSDGPVELEGEQSRIMARRTIGTGALFDDTIGGCDDSGESGGDTNRGAIEVRFDCDGQGEGECLLAPAQRGSNFDCSGTGETYVPPPPGLYITAFYSHQDEWWGNEEFRIFGKFVNGNTNSTDSPHTFPVECMPTYMVYVSVPGREYVVMNELLSHVHNIDMVDCAPGYGPGGFFVELESTWWGLWGEAGHRYFYGPASVPSGAQIGRHEPYVMYRYYQWQEQASMTLRFR